MAAASAPDEEGTLDVLGRAALFGGRTGGGGGGGGDGSDSARAASAAEESGGPAAVDQDSGAGLRDLVRELGDLDGGVGSLGLVLVVVAARTSSTSRSGDFSSSSRVRSGPEDDSVTLVGFACSAPPSSSSLLCTACGGRAVEASSSTEAASRSRHGCCDGVSAESACSIT